MRSRKKALLAAAAWCVVVAVSLGACSASDDAPDRAAPGTDDGGPSSSSPESGAGGGGATGGNGNADGGGVARSGDGAAADAMAPCMSAVDCTPGQICRTGLCVARGCQQGEQRCGSGGLETCLADGSAFGPPTPCPGSQVCVVDTCLDVVCTPGSTECAGNGDVVVCSDDGTQIAQRNACPAGQRCSAGVCQPAPACGGAACPGASCVELSGRCFYLANDTGTLTRAEALAECQALGAGWDFCTLAEICQQGVYDYLAAQGCGCAETDACFDAFLPGLPGNAHVHAIDETSGVSIIVSDTTLPNCVGGICQPSGSVATGAALCCR